MVGDGLNDIPCLQEACIGVSINAKSQLNIQASDIIMLSQNLYKIPTLVKLINRGNTFIKINLLWAFAYNLSIMPIVAGLFYSYGVTVSPVWSSVAMSCSSILVVGFSHLLALFRYDYEPASVDQQAEVVQNEDESMGQRTERALNRYDTMEE